MVRRLWVALALVLLNLTATAQEQSGDERILAAREAVRSGDRKTLDQLAARPTGHPLDSYVRYWRLFNLLARPEPAPVSDLIEFQLEEPGSLLAERLRSDWLRRMVRDRDWEGVIQLFPDLREPDAELRCLYRVARLEAGDMGVLAEVRERWMSLTDNHKACDPVLRTLALTGEVGLDELWWRVRRQIEGRTPEVARTTLAWFPANEAPASSEFDRVLRAPASYLDRLPPNFGATRAGRELAVTALVRVARENAETAARHLERIGSRLGNDERAYVFAVLGHHGALQGLPGANAWFRAAGNVPMTSEQRAWRVRSALRVESWRDVRAAIEALPPAEQALPEWTYWLARALSQESRTAEAQALYERIAGLPVFYGILAGDELGRRFSLPASGPALHDASTRVEQDAGLRRALALFRLDLRTEGVREWNWALRGQDEAFLIAAARLALRHELFDRAINTAELANQQAHFDLRFVAPFRHLVEPQVRQQGLDMAWVYGIMRQESRFVVPARSSSGAQGLMQVMPATGKWVAGKIGLRSYNPGMLADPDTNVLLGTSYMRIIMEELDSHPVLASAGYNAGPSRARRWRDNRPLEGAIYAETIPFDETRDYVKKVMTNAVIYAALFEARPQSLKGRLGTIAPRPPDGR